MAKEYTADGLKLLGAQWINRIQQSEKREEKWRKDAEAAETAYLAGQGIDENSGAGVPEWNILHSNVETIVPAIYNSTPQPDIRARHNNEDDLAKEAASIWERAIATLIDDNVLDSEIEAESQDEFVAGRGVLRLRFDADVEDIVQQYTDGSEETLGQRVVNESILFENVSWRNYREGPAKRWAEVPWVAFQHFLSMDEIRKIEDPELAKKQKDKTDPEEEEKDQAVWEIWCRETGKVYFVSNAKNRVLSIEDDPIGLKGFFPMPEPLQPITGTGSRIPVCPYSIYKPQAEELNLISRRIKAITQGLKVRGGIAGGAGAIQQMAEAGDNELVPIQDVEGLVAGGGIEKAVIWWPVDKAITVLRELYIARDQIKNSIYEITGISDIIRGQGVASETATAQQIKTEWGSLRVKKMQRMTERQVRDIFKLCAEIMSLQFRPERIAQLAGVQFQPEVAEFLKQPFDHYRIDVESDSTIRSDTSKRREEMARFLEGTASFFQVMAPLVAQGPEAAAPIAEIYGAFTAQFQLGKTAEDAVEQLVDMAKEMASKPKPNPEKEAREADARIKQAELQLKGQELEQKKAEGAAKAQTEAAKLKIDQEKLGIEREKMLLDAQVQTGQFDVQRAESLASAGGELAQVMIPVVQAMQDANAQQNAALAALVQHLTQRDDAMAERMAARDEMLVRAITAPKQITKDENGRPIGVETMAVN